MTNFKMFFEATETEKDALSTLEKLPEIYRNLIKGYKFKWESGTTLKGDDEHIGIINPKTKTITIAAPWNYGREFTLLHELGHCVWAQFVNQPMRKQWGMVVNKNKHRDTKENDEENFCHAFACYFSKQKILKHYHPAWQQFIKRLVSMTT